MTKIFDPAGIARHIGTEVKFRDRLRSLTELEDYFSARCGEAGIESSYDVTADENTYFKTLNYTTYAGLFIMHPLQFSMSLFQMYDAKADRAEPVGHIEWLRKQLAQRQVSKYVLPDGSELQDYEPVDNYTHVAVLPGSNKFYEHVSKKKFVAMCEAHGSRLVLKPHPITNQKVLGEIGVFKKSAQLANRHHNLYTLMANAEVVLTTHISETALTGLLMGKRVVPLDPFKSRFVGSFSHINHFCFTEAEPIAALDSIFASPKSGVVHPEVDADWKGKIDAYIEYIMGQRKRQLNHYYE